MTMASQPANTASKHDLIERNLTLLIVLVILVVSVGGLVEIVPLFFQKSTTEAVAGLKPYSAVQLAGRDVYVREGCNNCHTQMIRPFRAETERYGHYSVAGEFVYDRPHLWGSKRTGPDLHRVGGRYSDEWHRVHLTDPRIEVCAYPSGEDPDGDGFWQMTLQTVRETAKRHANRSADRCRGQSAWRFRVSQRAAARLLHPREPPADANGPGRSGIAAWTLLSFGGRRLCR